MKRIFWFILICVSGYLFLFRTHVVVNATTTCPSGNVWSITDFGANGNDSEDDYYALLQASQCASNKENITLYFPAGHYYIKEYRITGVTKDGRQPNGVQNIVYNNCNGLRIIGAGQDRTVIDVKGDYHMTADKEGYDGIEGHSLSYSMDVIPFFFNNCSNVYLGGFELDGNFDQTTVDRSIFQPHTSMGVFVHGTLDFTLAKLNVHHFAEDGVYLGGGNIDRNGLIYQIDSHHNGRQGMSITNARGVTVVNSVFRDTGYAPGKRFPPGCGVDIEPDEDHPDQPNNRTGDILFVQNQYSNNRGHTRGGDPICNSTDYGGANIGKPMGIQAYNTPLVISSSVNYPLLPPINMCVWSYKPEGFDTFYFSKNRCGYSNLEHAHLDYLNLVKGKITIQVDTAGMNTIQYFLDNDPITQVVPANSPVTIDTTAYTNGKHALSATATTTSGTVNYRQVVLVIINLPEAAPSIAPHPFGIDNSGFESNLTGWNFWNGGSSTSTSVVHTTNTSHTGNASAKIHINSPNTPGQYPNDVSFYQNQLNAANYKGKKIAAKVWTKTANGGKSGIGISMSNSSNVWTYRLASSGIFEHTQWIQISSQPFNVPNDISAIRFELFGQVQGGDIWFDDATVEEYVAPTNTPTLKPGDFNGDGAVNLLDYNKLVSNFGNPYTIFDYNTLVGNFGH